MSGWERIAFVLLSAGAVFTAQPANGGAPGGAPQPGPAPTVDSARSTVTPEAGTAPGRRSLEGKDLCTRARAPHLRSRPSGSGSPREADADTDVTHYFLDVEVIPEYTGPDVSAVKVAGVCTIDARSTANGLTTFTVDLRDNLAVNAVTGDVGGWSRVGHTIEITLDRAYNAGEAFQVAVDYEGYPQTGGFAAFKWWTRVGSGSLTIGTLAEPFYAHYWWPCKDALNDKATMQMHCTVPDGFVAVSNGLDEGTTPVPPGRTKYMWNVTYQMIPYLASLAITDYERYDLVYNYDDGGPQTLSVPCYLYPEHWDFPNGQPQASFKTGCDELPTMLAKLGERFGLYPFLGEKYGVAETGGSGGIYANMEHQTISSMWRVENYSNIMCHELAHQWWGDAVTCETWYDIWLNEGFASYAECLYREIKPGGGFGSYMSRVMARLPSDPDAQVYRTSIATVGDIFSTNDVYNKGCWVLHMLRHVMGDAAFFAALLDYRAAYEGDSATTAEYTAALSTSFGYDLAWFTDEWVMNPGSPDYDYAWHHAASGGQDFLHLQITQTQGDRGYVPMIMPVDIAVTTANGTSTYVVWVLNAVDGFALPIDGTPTAVQLDPGDWILTHSVVESSSSAFPVVCPGDMNEDGAVNGADIPALINAMLDPTGAPASWQRSDMNLDGRGDVNDVPLFVQALLGLDGCPGGP